jgi:predicted ribosome quality control (RQC) complex YloA/Tae2 family protein
MKNSLSSVDVYLLVDELSERLAGAWVDKVYQISSREMKLKVRMQGEGAAELVLAPNYFCLTTYVREAPEQPTSFAMQLRKHLTGARIKEIRQHGFDRIVELSMEKGGETHYLVAEFFSRGNIILCDSDWKIIGILERQRWKDRTLSVGQKYAYPPAGRSPLEIDKETFSQILSASEKSLAATIASDAGLGGLYAEEACARAGIAKEERAAALSAEAAGGLFAVFRELLEMIVAGSRTPAIILDAEGKYLDVIPFSMRAYEKNERKEYPTLNDAVDVYFSEGDFALKSRAKEDKIAEKIAQLKAIEEKQEETVASLREKAVEYQKIGDAIYANFQTFSSLLSAIDAEKQKGSDWKSITEKLRGKKVGSISLADVVEGSLIVEVEG